MSYENNPSSLTTERFDPAEEAIRLRSYQIWEREGRPQGCSQEHWARAKAELEAEMQQASIAGVTADIVLPRLNISTPPVRTIADKPDIAK